LGSGTGSFTGSSTLNLNNPPHRDTATLPGGGWLVVAFQADNPGAWLMHCHVAFHVSEGFGNQFLERSSKIVSATGGAAFENSGCSSWNSFEVTRNIQPNDSGV
jgi:hypothetical protein